MNPRTATNTVSSQERPALLLRPPQGEDESFPAYLTRLRTVNGLTGILTLARRLRLSEGELVTLEPAALQGLLHGDRSQAAAHCRRYRRRTSQLLRTRADNSTATRICPLCFRDGRLHPMHWDRPLTIICAVHQLCLIDRCSECRRPISHRRAHMYFCVCGADFRKCSQSPKPLWLDCLYQLFAPWRLREALERLELLDRERRSLVILLKFLTPLPVLLGTRICHSRSDSCMKLDLSLIGEIGNLLSEWPVNFQQRVLDMYEISRDLIWGLKLRISKLQLVRLRNAIKATLDQRRRDNRLHQMEQREFQRPGPISTMEELVQLTGTSERTIVKAIAAGTIKGTIVERGKQKTYKRITVAMPESRRLRALSRCSIGYASAARHIGCLPLYIRLFVLWGDLPSIQYTQCPLTWRFRVKHLNQLMSKLNALAGPARVATGPLCTLANATPRSVRRSPTLAWKTFTRDILEGKVRLYRIGGEVTDFSSLAVQIGNLPIGLGAKRRLLSGERPG